MIDFSSCEVNKFKAYGGANGNKIHVRYNGTGYMLKFPSVANRNKTMSYTNGCVSEYLACHIFEALGIKTQETLLGTYTDRRGKEKIVVACADFTNEGKKLIEFAQLKNTCINSEQNGYGTELSSVMEAIEEQSLLPPDKLRNFFWEIFIADALLGNFDRHNGNWGILVDEQNQTAEIAPVYDCGSCLYPQLAVEDMKSVLENKEEINMRKRVAQVIVFVLLLTIVLSSLLNSDLYASTSFKAKGVNSDVLLDGEHIWLTGLNIAGVNYYNIYNIAEIFCGTTSNFSVFYNNKKNSIEITTGKNYIPIKNRNYTFYEDNRIYNVKLSTRKIYVNSKLVNIKTYSYGGDDFFNPKDVGKLIPFDVEYDSTKKLTALYTKIPQNAYRATASFSSSANSISSSFPRWRETQTSYLVKNNDQTISVVEFNSGNVTIETYDNKYKLIFQKSIKPELPIFGAFYSGEKYNYIAFGQQNMEENDNKEVIRIVRYDKNFKRIDSVSIKGGESYTTIPFEAAYGRMAESGNTMVFHTSRQRYKTEYGLHHQSQLTIIINTSTMSITNSMGRFQSNHVSHSFDQYVQFDGSDEVLIDHGDAFPRSIVLHKPVEVYENSDYLAIDLFKIPGSVGANCTGVCVGGFEISSENYIVAINSINHSLVKEYTSFTMEGLKDDQRDIIICTAPRQNTSEAQVKQITLAKYVGSKQIASIPKLVKITDEKFMVLWQEFSLSDNSPGDVKYVYIDKAGNAISSIESLRGYTLSTCQPIVVGNSVVWYCNKGYIIFYTVPISN